MRRAPRSTCVGAAIVRTRTFAGRSAGRETSASTDELVDPRGERAQHRDGRAERRVVRIDALGDHDELHRSTSSRTLAAYSSGETSQPRLQPAPPRPGRSNRSRSPTSSTSAAAIASGSGDDEHAVDTVMHEVRDAADRAAEHRPAAQLRLDHDAAHPLRPRGQDEQAGLVEGRDDLLRVEAAVPDASLGDEAPGQVGACAVADDPQRRVRDLRRARTATRRPARRRSCTAPARR